MRALSPLPAPITHTSSCASAAGELVDRLGGASWTSRRLHLDTSGITLTAGTQTLNGEEASPLLMSATPSSGDFSRAAQRAIISHCR
ncbi:MAG: hypothetical protein ACLSDQ_07790 [Adlercreutzia equolifaciens]